MVGHQQCLIQRFEMIKFIFIKQRKFPLCNSWVLWPWNIVPITSINKRMEEVIIFFSLNTFLKLGGNLQTSLSREGYTEGQIGLCGTHRNVGAYRAWKQLSLDDSISIPISPLCPHVLWGLAPIAVFLPESILLLSFMQQWTLSWWCWWCVKAGDEMRADDVCFVLTDLPGTPSYFPDYSSLRFDFQGISSTLSAGWVRWLSSGNAWISAFFFSLMLHNILQYKSTII